MRLLSVFICLLIFGISAPLQASSSFKKRKRFYQKILKEIHHVQKMNIPDPITKGSINKNLLKAFNKNNKPIGFIRDVVTSTGCNDGCLPVIFTLFYNNHGEFLAVKSKIGLTKKDHAPFTPEDYLQLDFILRKNPPSFEAITHPTEMVDGITRATRKYFEPDVVKQAAYTTYRINSYHQQTLNYIKGLKK